MEYRHLVLMDSDKANQERESAVDDPSLGSDFWVRWVAKIIVFSIPPIMLSIYLPGRGHQLLFDLSMILGVLLQAFIPPRKNGLLLLLCMVAVISVMNFIFWR